MNNPKQEPSGIGGWLLVLVIHLIIGPLFGIGYAYNNIMTSESQFPQLLTLDKWATYKSVTWCFLTIVAVLRYYCVWDLLDGKTQSTIKRSIVIMWVTAPIATLVLSLLIPITIFGDSWVVDERTVNWVVGGAITAAIWTAYLLKSVRVRNTYGEAQAQQNGKDVHTPKIISVENLNEPTLLDSTQKNKPQPAKEPHFKMIEPSSNEQIDSSSSQGGFDLKTENITNVEQKPSVPENAELPVARPLNISDDRIYEKALEEIEDNKPHKASWARAFSEAEGDEVKTKALYIKLRVANIKEKLRREGEKREAEARRIQDLRDQEARRLLAEKEKIELANSKAQMFDELDEKWSIIIRKHEKILAADNLADYLYDIPQKPLHERTHLAKWLMTCDRNWFLRTITAGPEKISLGNYGIILLIALEKGIDIQCAKKWGRPSRFERLDKQEEMEDKTT